MIHLFLLGKKGLESIEGLNPVYFKNISALIIGNDKEVINDYAEEIETFAKSQNIPYIFRNQTLPETIAQNTLNIAIGWRWLIPLDVPLIVFHDSILPQYRGFNPLVSALINGDEQIGVTALFGTDEFDKGAIIGQRIIPIGYPIKIEQAIEAIAKEYAVLLQQIILNFTAGSLEGKIQDESQATFSLWRDEEDYQIDWSLDSMEIKRTIDAVGFPYKGACTNYEETKVRIFDAEVWPDVNIINRTAGKVLFKHEDAYIIVCGKGLLKIKDFFSDNGEKLTMNKFRLRFK